MKSSLHHLATRWGHRLWSWGLLRPRTPILRRFALEAPEPSLRGLRIAFVSDLHLGLYTGLEVLGAVRQRLMEAAPDLIVVGGDLVRAYDEEAAQDNAARVLSELSQVPATLGRYVVAGNHDLSEGVEHVLRSAEMYGFSYLQDAGVSLQVGEGRLYLAGLEECSRAHPDVARALRGHQGEPVLMIVHRPDSVIEFLPAEVPTWLVLSGHLHGMPRTRNSWLQKLHPSRYPEHFGYGFCTYQGRRIFITAGVGCAAIALRGLRRAEVCLFQLH